VLLSYPFKFVVMVSHSGIGEAQFALSYTLQNSNKQSTDAGEGIEVYNAVKGADGSVEYEYIENENESTQIMLIAIAGGVLFVVCIGFTIMCRRQYRHNEHLKQEYSEMQNWKKNAIATDPDALTVKAPSKTSSPQKNESVFNALREYDHLPNDTE
jgi:hypothetical protein